MSLEQQPVADRATGPEFELVDCVRYDEIGGFRRANRPLLVKGAVRMWPAWEKWSFEHLASLRKPDGSEAVARFITGVVEQGATRETFDAPVGPYLRELARTADRAVAAPDPDRGLLPARRLNKLATGERFRLNWSHLNTFVPDRVYLSQWQILREFPELRRDFAIRKLWPGLRFLWEYVFLGPANTITGFHYDIPDNWFCQVRGTKEVLLVPADQSHHMCQSRKFDWGATLSAIDISRPGEQVREWASFAKVRALYARVEAGDALFIPKGTWHAVVALEPSISLAVFGLTPYSVVVDGAWAELKRLLHAVRLYRWGNCTCHTGR
jgi:lysine-specific demethylase 8